MEDLILDVHEAAELLKVPVSQIYALAKRKGNPSFRLGRHIRFNREKLLQYVSR